MLHLEVLVSSLEAAVLGDQGLVLSGLALVQLLQAFVVLEQGLVEPLEVLALLQHGLALALQGRLLDQQLRVLVHQGCALRVQRGVLHLQSGTRGHSWVSSAPISTLLGFNPQRPSGCSTGNLFVAISLQCQVTLEKWIASDPDKSQIFDMIKIKGTLTLAWTFILKKLLSP